MSAYKKPQTQDVQQHYENTKARIQKIQSHLAHSPRGIRLKDKVIIITGVGSLKGIGYVITGRPRIVPLIMHVI